MTVEGILRTLNKADCIVIEAETKYVNELREDIEQTAREGREGEHDLLINELIKEGKRLNKKPLQLYDEEEYLIGKLIKKK
ncbi:hypothetical protein M0R04_12615 [Candidatus Dojkabacteria bacterium]|jgi:hypothetical protein|nr:hypothetical protein [Candidatus Dojkabacteria bacterium]